MENMRRARLPAGKQVLITAKLRLLQPDTDGGSRMFRQLNLHWPLRFPLNHHGSREYLGPMRNVAYPKADEIAAAKLAVDSRIEHGQIADCMCVLKVNSDSPDVLRLQGWFLSDELSLVPHFAFFRDFHDRFLDRGSGSDFSPSAKRLLSAVMLYACCPPSAVDHRYI
jgi:hypothetical protein